MLNSPFLQTGAAKTLSRGLLKSGKLSFNGIITNLEKTVSTINQVVPLYKQVKPLINNSKTLINAFKSTKENTNKKRKSPPFTQQKQHLNPTNIINVEATISPSTSKQETTSENYDIYENHDSPSNAFFI